MESFTTTQEGILRRGSRGRKKSSNSKTPQSSEPSTRAQDHQEDSSDAEAEAQESELDEDEEALERLVLGDDDGFRAVLSMNMDVDEEEQPNGVEMQEDEREAAGLENVDDADVRERLP